jgi:hypothetical protein
VRGHRGCQRAHCPHSRGRLASVAWRQRWAHCQHTHTHIIDCAPGDAEVQRVVRRRGPGQHASDHLVGAAHGTRGWERLGRALLRRRLQLRQRGASLPSHLRRAGRRLRAAAAAAAAAASQVPLHAASQPPTNRRGRRQPRPSGVQQAIGAGGGGGVPRPCHGGRGRTADDTRSHHAVAPGLFAALREISQRRGSVVLLLLPHRMHRWQVLARQRRRASLHRAALSPLGASPPRAVAVTAAAAAAAAAPTVQRGIAHHLRAAVAEAGGERLAVRRLRERAVPVRMMLPRLGLGLGLGHGHWVVVVLRRESDSRLLALG